MRSIALAACSMALGAVRLVKLLALGDDFRRHAERERISHRVPALAVGKAGKRRHELFDIAFGHLGVPVSRGGLPGEVSPTQ